MGRTFFPGSNRFSRVMVGIARRTVNETLRVTYDGTIVSALVPRKIANSNAEDSEVVVTTGLRIAQ